MVQLLETQQLRKGVANHPLMFVAMEARERELQEQIEALPLGSKGAGRNDSVREGEIAK